MKTLRLLVVLSVITAAPVIISNLNDLGDKLKSTAGLYPLLFWTYDNKLWILPFLAILAIVVPSYKVATTESKVKSSVAKKLLHTLLTDVFDNEWENIRVTIFRDVSWWKIFWIWTKNTICHPYLWIVRGGKHVFPLPWNKYIISTARAGTENPHPQTYFLFVEKTASECEGIASYAKQINRDNRREVLIDDLPDINGLDLTNISTLTDAERTALTTYMQATHIKDVRVLKRLHRKAKHFFAMALTDDKLDLKAILVVDSMTDASPFDDNTKDKVGSYVKIFSTTF